MSKHLFVVGIEVPDDFETVYDGRTLSGQSLAAQILAERLNYEEDLNELGRPEYAIWDQGDLGLQPGDMAVHIGGELDPREVVSVGRDFVTLDILGTQTGPLPKDNYRPGFRAEGQF